jgi:chemotaxis protein methyltransferase CheR
MTHWKRELHDLLRRRTGIRLRRDHDWHTVEDLVRTRMQELSLGSAADYVHLLYGQSLRSDEFSQLIGGLTNSHSYFFRDERQLAALTRTLQQVAERAQRPLAIWSAGCASGEEPYSLAILCDELGLDLQILATDISLGALQQAGQARYKSWALRHVPAALRRRYFSRDGSQHELDPQIRGRVELRHHNLVLDPFPRPDPPAAGWDLIICRNVFIYFDDDSIQAVALRFAGALNPRGWLCLGAAERLNDRGCPFAVVPVDEAFLYRLDRPARQPAAGWEGSTPTLPVELPPEPPPPGALETAERGGDPAATLHGPPGVGYHQAVELLESGQRTVALELLEQLLEQDPGHVVARVTLGNLLLSEHAFDAAHDAYREARQRQPLLAEVHYLQGVVLRKLGRLDLAEGAFRHALFLQPDFWCASFMLAGIHGRRGNSEQRRRFLKLTLAILKRGQAPRLYASHVRGIKDVDLDPGEVRTLCRRYLRRMTGAAAAPAA